MLGVARAGTRWPAVILACVCVPSFISADHTGRQQVQAMVPRGDASSNSSALIIQDPPLAFRAAVNVLIVDVQVAAAPGKLVPALAAAQFEVTIAGRKRTVVLAEFVHTDEGTIT